MPEETKTVRASAEVLLERRRRFRQTRVRELKMIAKALASTKHPVLVHHSDAALQSGLWVLQRVRQRIEARAA